MPSVAILGASLAGLNLARLLLIRGWDVSLYTESGPVGGFHAGLSLWGRTFDHGAVVLELGGLQPSDALDLTDFEPRKFNDYARYLDLIPTFLSELGLKPEALLDPKIFFRGHELADFLGSDHMEGLAQLPPAMRAQILSELPDDPDPLLHPRQKARWDSASGPSLCEVSLANHGSTLHLAFWEGWCQRLTGQSSSAMLAKYHRRLWLPIFYPESIRAALHGQPQSFRRAACAGLAGGANRVVERLRSELQSSRLNWLAARSVAVVGGRGNWRVSSDDGRSAAFDEVVWTGDLAGILQRLTGNAGEPLERADLSITYLLVPRRALLRQFSIVYLTQEDSRGYRVSLTPSSQDSFLQIAYETASGGDAGEEAIMQLGRLGLIDTEDPLIRWEGRQFRQAFVLPTRANALRFERQRAELDRLAPGLHCAGAGQGLYSSTLNEQILHSLWLDSVVLR